MIAGKALHMFKKIVIGIIVVVFLVFSYAMVQPSEYVVARSTVINAPAEKIFPHLNNQKLAQNWGPWMEVDPKATMTLEGPEEGMGSKTSWKSDGQLGHGSATITESIPNQKVHIRLEYTKPFNMTQESDYLLESADAGTKVTWRVEGKNNIIGKVMCLFGNMDKMVGGVFEKGLAKLKSEVEKTL